GYAGKILAYCIAGHHADLADCFTSTGQSSLSDRLKKPIHSLAAVPEKLRTAERLDPPPLTLTDDAEHNAFQIAFFCRMLFSCLVDADYLATEEFMDRARSQAREIAYPTLAEMKGHLDQHLDSLAANADDTDVNRARQQILAACRTSAQNSQGMFSLTVPTGGGKTLASLAFALEHIAFHAEHPFERIIYGIPFTSIIEQTADQYRKVFDRLFEALPLEHHSNLDPEGETLWQRLTTENWDAPLIVTTNVQFFESLFAAKTSRCRKLHRIVNSVIILDEAQTLPVEFLKPCLMALKTLAQDYGCTIVLCTATQPAINRRPDFPIGLQEPTEIIPDPPQLYKRMKRVEAHFIGEISDEELIDRLSPQEQFLTIVNTRGHAAELFEVLRKRLTDPDRESLFHVSTMMCGAHRTDVIEKIRDRLEAKLPCRVISTQLIEAGVDVDFPLVYRALTGLDSIAQAAGRCNREGKLPKGDIFVFKPMGRKLRGMLESTANTTAELLPDLDDLLALDAMERYFELHYWKQSNLWDHHGVLAQFKDPVQLVFQFRTAASLFRMIQETTQPVIVPYDSRATKLIDQLMLEEPPGRGIRRQLQRYTVPIYENVFQKLKEKDIEVRHEAFP
ncbi:MAG: CRISPR-associated helicase Cas3', partial [Planctomycetaceae bacterium]|nr:CRISPR-associated helicase Cas3' [Planctomycetaceae bacterium]